MILLELQQIYLHYHQVTYIKIKYLTIEEIVRSKQHRIKQKTKFAYSALAKAFEKQTKTIEKHGEIQVQALQSLKTN